MCRHADGFQHHLGEAYALGERTPLALVNAPRPGAWRWRGAHQHRGGAHRKIGDIKLSANWMAAAGHHGEDARCSTRCTRWAWNCARAWHRHSCRQGLDEHEVYMDRWC